MTGFFSTTRPRHGAPRPRLRAAWHVDAAGHIACRWQADPEEPPSRR